MSETEKTRVPRAIVAVAPVLLADALWRALRLEGLDVALYESGDAQLPAEPQQYALALVSGELPADVHADVVISLPDLPVADLPSVVGLVRSSLGAQLGPAGSSIT